MARWYGVTTFSLMKFKDFMPILFGPSANRIPDFYIPNNLNYLVSVTNLSRSEFFANTSAIIEKMTVIPFYSYFLSMEKN